MLVPLGLHEQLMVFGMALFCAVFFGKINQIFPGAMTLAALCGRLAAGWVLAWGLMAVLLVLTKTAESVSRLWLVGWLVTSIPLLWVGRAISFFIVSNLHRAGYQNKTVLIYGAPDMIGTVLERVRRASASGCTSLASTPASR